MCVHISERSQPMLVLRQTMHTAVALFCLYLSIYWTNPYSSCTWHVLSLCHWLCNGVSLFIPSSYVNFNNFRGWISWAAINKVPWGNVNDEEAVVDHAEVQVLCMVTNQKMMKGMSFIFNRAFYEKKKKQILNRAVILHFPPPISLLGQWSSLFILFSFVHSFQRKKRKKAQQIYLFYQEKLNKFIWSSFL